MIVNMNPNKISNGKKMSNCLRSYTMTEYINWQEV